MSFSLADLQNITARAATLDERFQSTNFDATDDKTIDQRLEKWRRSSAGGDMQKWRTRLALDGWSEAGACRAAQNLSVQSIEIAPWARALEQIFASFDAATWNESQSINSRWPFEVAFAPFLVFAARDFLLFESLPTSARDDLLGALSIRLSTLAAPTLALEWSVAQTIGKVPRDSSSSLFHDAFIAKLLAGGWVKICLEYPVLARQMTQFCLDWQDAAREMLKRLQHDRDALENHFCIDTGANLTHIEANLSDPHGGGRSVAILWFECGQKVVYKPKNLGAESAFFEFLSELNRRTAPQNLAPSHFAAPRALKRAGYGWVEWIPSAPLSGRAAASGRDATLFYHRAGALLCVLHLLDATDCHCDNLVARGDFPVLIDAEALLSPRVRLAPGGAALRAARWLDDSVLRCGLLPQFEAGPDVQTAYDISGLGGAGQNGPRGAQIRRLNWHHVGTDAQQLMEIWAPPPIPHNAPFHMDVEGKTVEVEPSDYALAMVQGFRETHEFLRLQRAWILEKDGPLERLSHHFVRWIFRATGVYGALLETARRPHNLRDGWDRAVALDAISRTFLSGEMQDLWPLHTQEMRQLERGDIPFFEVSPRSDSPLQGAAPLFEAAPLSSVKTRFETWNDATCAAQCDIIREVWRARRAGKSASLAPEKPVQKPKSSPENADFEAIATQIARDFTIRAVRDGEEAAWITTGFSPRTLRYQLQPTGAGLYEGSAGIALFLAAAWKCGGDEQFRDLARAAMRGALHTNASGRENGLGLAEGKSGIIFALAHLGALLSEEEWTDRAQKMASALEVSHLEADAQLDVLGGVAGVILGVLSLPNAIQDANLRQILETCGARLLKSQVETATETENGAAWPTLDGKLLCGLSHGAAGIGLALARLGAATGEKKWLEAAKRGFDFERAQMNTQALDWPDLRFENSKDAAHFTISWCHGAPGIALSRADALSVMGEANWRREWEFDLQIALSATRRAPLSEIDHVCCGNLGRAAALRIANFDAARDLTGEICERAQKNGGFALLPGVEAGGFCAGLWNGAAGVGFHLLQMARPNVLPDLWDFSAPSTTT